MQDWQVDFLKRVFSTLAPTYTDVLNNPMGEFHAEPESKNNDCQSESDWSAPKTNRKMFEITYNIDGFIQAGFVYAKNPNEAKNNFNSYVYKHADQYGEWSTIEIIDIQERKEK